MLDQRILIASFNCNPPASSVALQQFEREAGFRLSRDYASFLQQANGGEGFVGPNSYLILWRVEELLSLNQAYEVAEFAPGLFLFGSDGGGEAFALDRRDERERIVSVPFVGMDLALIRSQGAGFWEFIEGLYKA